MVRQRGRPSDRQIADFFSGRCAEDDELWIAEYLASHPEIAERGAQRAASDDSLLSDLLCVSDRYGEDVLAYLAMERLKRSGEHARFPLPDSIGDYRLREPLHIGGRSAVFRAWDVRLERDVALKILHPTVAKRNPLWEACFRRESRLLDGLDSHHIVRYYQSGSEAGHQYVATELVTGYDVAFVVRQLGPMLPGAACAVITQMCDALEHLEKRQIVHRDMKPSNIVLGLDGVAKLIDFGMAKRVGDNGFDSAQQALIGTVDYMSPEQALHPGRASHQSDIYSLGCVLFFMLTATPPFADAGDSPVKTLLAHALQPFPDPRASVPAVPEPIVASLQTMCHKDPDCRYESVQSVKQAIAPYACADELSQLTESLRNLGPWPVRGVQAIDDLALHPTDPEEHCITDRDGSRHLPARWRFALVALILILVGLMFPLIWPITLEHRGERTVERESSIGRSHAGTDEVPPTGVEPREVPSGPQHVVRSPVVGSGRWRRIPDGSFHRFRSDQLVGWEPQVPGQQTVIGTFLSEQQRGADDSFSAAAIVTHEQYWAGFALIGGYVEVQPGKPHVLSAYFHTEQLSSGALYVDLTDITGDIDLQSRIGLPGWHFVWGEFTPMTNRVRVRLVRGGDHIIPGEVGYIDCVGVTPLDEFRPPEDRSDSR